MFSDDSVVFYKIDCYLVVKNSQYIYKLDGITCIAVAQVVDADGCQGSEERGYGCGNQGDAGLSGI